MDEQRNLAASPWATLTPGKVYRITVRAIGGSTGQSDWSMPVTIMATRDVAIAPDETKTARHKSRAVFIFWSAGSAAYIALLVDDIPMELVPHIVMELVDVQLFLEAGAESCSTFTMMQPVRQKAANTPNTVRMIILLFMVFFIYWMIWFKTPRAHIGNDSGTYAQHNLRSISDPHDSLPACGA